MNTNGNAYTVIYTTIVVALVAAILAFVAMTLKPKQDANIKAETISQMLTAAQFYTKDECSAMGNDKVLEAYSQNIKEAYTINLKGEKVRDLNTEVKSIELQDGLKAQNKNIKDGSDAADLPVYVFTRMESLSLSSLSMALVFGDLSGATSLWTRIFRQSWALTSITTARLLVSAPRSRTIRLSGLSSSARR